MSDSPIVRRRRNVFFPHGGNRNYEKHWNSTSNPLNKRRFRVDPLKDGHDPGENPVNPPSPNKPDIPI